MGRTLLNAALALLLFASLAINWAVDSDRTQRNFELFPDMVHSVAFDAFSPNPNFSDGMTLRTPPRGTIARGQMPLRFEGTPADAIRAGVELANPLGPADQAALRRGAEVYGTFCRTCHGPTGLGDGPVTLRGVSAPPSLLAPHARDLKDGQIFHILTYGQNNMASYASQLSADDRWRAVLHVRALQRDAAQPGGGAAR
jgi:mono/diheme cytochrome c family protein